MIDEKYIEEIKTLPLKEARLALIEYGKNYGITLKKKAIDVMVEELTNHIKALADEPMPEENNGISTSEMLDQVGSAQDAQIENKLDLNDFDSVILDTPDEDSVQNKEVDDIPTDVSETLVEEHHTNKSTYKLPENFSPTLLMFGHGPKSFCTLPWWIYEWISRTPNWKENPNSFPEYHGLETILSLIYYIQRDGQVIIRETKNSSFVTLS